MSKSVEQMDEDNSAMVYPMFRILQLDFKNHSEYWVQRSIRILGIHLKWKNTTLNYHLTMDDAKKDLEDRTGRKLFIFLQQNKKNIMSVTIPIHQTKAIAAFNNADENGKKLLTDLLGKENLVPKNIRDLVSDFNDILRLANCTMGSLINPNDTPDEIAYKQAKLISLVYNNGDVLDPMNTKQNKYFPWHEIDPKSGSGLLYYDCVYWFSDSIVGVRLCFVRREDAIDAGKKFIDIYVALKIK